MSYTKLILIVAVGCASLISKAQEDCGIVSNYYWEFNPNNVVVFFDTTQVEEGWEIVSYQWDFGDGTPDSFQENASHVYDQPGVYDVCHLVTAFNAELNETCTSEHCLPYAHCGFINGMFTYSMEGNTALFVATGEAQVQPMSYQWNFGDNTPMGSGQTAVHQFQNAGTYQVCLTIYDGYECTYTVCMPIVINSLSCEGVEASFEHSVFGDEIFVSSTSNTNGIQLGYQWSINGVATDMTAGMEVYEWVNLAPGTYDICLTVGANGSVCDTDCESVEVGGNPLCNGFDVEILPDTISDNQIILTAFPTGGTAPFSYQWSNGEVGSQIIVSSDDFELYCVFAYDNFQCEAQACDTINGSNNCNMLLDINATTSGNISVLQAFVSGGTAPYTYTWLNPSNNGSVLTVDGPGTYCAYVVDAQGCSATACYTVPNTTASDTLCGYVFNDLNGNGIFNESESGIEDAYVQLGNYSALTDANGFWQAIVPTGTYYIYYCADGGNIITVPSGNPSSGTNGNCANYYGIASNSSNGNCNYNFGVQLVSFSVCGNVYFDADGNGEQTSNTESGLNAVNVQAESSDGSIFQTYTNTLGDYCIWLPAGDYTLTVGGTAFEGCTIAPQQISISGVAGQSLSDQNFAVQCEPGSCNLAIEVIPSTTVTPGFPGWYNVYVCNVGTTLASGTANYFYDNTALTLNYSSPVAATHNPSVGHITFDVNNLLPGQCTSFWMSFDSPTNTPLGNSVFTMASIAADCNDFNLTNNTDTLHQIVVGSWDPNNKLAYHTNHDSNTDYQWISSVNADQRIEYVINFQNTGSAPAHNVVIEDFISEDLDMSTFEVLGASHPMYTLINGNDVNFRFDNIMLPDSTNNEPESHGFVRFAINANAGLSAGHIISDEAAIYFDFNEPVITNDAAVEFVNVVGVGEFDKQSTVLVYPNPMDQNVQFKNLSGKAFRLRITDSTGRVVVNNASTTDIITISRDGFASGLYLYEVYEGENQVAVGKLAVR